MNLCKGTIDEVESTEHPSITFVIPTLDAGKLLRGCLDSIKSQEYPQNKVEIMVVDGGSKDDTLNIARQFGCRIFHSPRTLTGPGYELGITTGPSYEFGLQEARSDLVVFHSADVWLPRTDWLRLMTKPFQEDPKIIGAFGPFVVDRNDISLNRYFSWVESTPFHYFVCDSESSKKFYEKSYEVLIERLNYKIFKMTVEKYPILGLGNGFVLNRGAVKSEGADAFPLSKVIRETTNNLDDISPIIKMIEHGYRIAYVPRGGIIHYHLQSYRQFLLKYRWKLRVNMFSRLGYSSARAYLSQKRRLKEKLFILYCILFFWPLITSVNGLKRDKDIAWLHHPILCFLILLMGILTILESPRLSIGYLLSSH